MNQRVQQAAAELDAMIGHRRTLHEHPEVGLDLPVTHRYIAAALADLGLDPEVHPGAGVSVRLPGASPDGVTSVLRVDMDALPVTERTDLPFSSRIPGAMHACGHDLHMATGLGVARVLTRHAPVRDTVLVFQPGEETDRGAVPTLAAHVSLRPDVRATAFAVHVHAQQPTGTIATRAGTFMAFGDWFQVDLAGPGGHASQPERAGNPIVAGADIVRGFGDVVQEASEERHLVATVTEFLMGNTVNVIPATGRLRGTLRTLDATQRSAVIDQLAQVVRDAGGRHGLDARWDLVEGYPAVVNDDAYVEALHQAISTAGLSPAVRPMPAPSMVIEDFAYFLHRWPGAMVYVGAHVPGCTSFNHADDVLFDESAMATSLALYLLAADGVL